MATETAAEEANFTYIPLSSFIILLVILLTCASRRKKNDPFNAAEQQGMENDIKAEYAIMCFPCLKKKPELSELEPTTDLSDQFEYIVEKYTIRKVPLLLANTAEDIIERQQELEMAKVPDSHPQLSKDDFVNFQVAQEVYNVQRIPPCITVAANTVCPGRKAIREKPKPSDILESMSPIPRPAIKNHNYVVIPTKGSLRNRDIMMTKREITNQYLNNFSSVFVDNLKDQVPKDPERFPSLSRPYSSALRNYPIPGQSYRSGGSRKFKRGKCHKVAYAFPLEDGNSVREEPYYDSDSIQDQTTEGLESEFQEDNEADTADMTDKSKSLVLLNDSDSGTEKDADGVQNPFKTTIKSSASDLEHHMLSSIDTGFHPPSIYSHKEEWTATKNVTYEDIQALDVGYEFTSCEKLGVKPKMTRIHYPHETDRLKESLKQLALGENKLGKKSFPIQDQGVHGGLGPKPNSRGSTSKSKRSPDLGGLNLYSSPFMSPLEKTSSKSVVAETSFLPKTEDKAEESSEVPAAQDATSVTSVTTKSEETKSQSVADMEVNTPSTIEDSVAEISKLYELARPVTQRTVEPSDYGHEKQLEEQVTRFPALSKSRSFHEAGRSGSRKGDGPAKVKGKDYLPFPNPNLTKKLISRLDEHETETSCSLYSRESKTSSVVTSPRSSDHDEGKRATLRWKIVIKHHREESSRKNVNVNIKH